MKPLVQNSLNKFMIRWWVIEDWVFVWLLVRSNSQWNLKTFVINSWMKTEYVFISILKNNPKIGCHQSVWSKIGSVYFGNCETTYKYTLCNVLCNVIESIEDRFVLREQRPKMITYRFILWHWLSWLRNRWWCGFN